MAHHQQKRGDASNTHILPRKHRKKINDTPTASPPQDKCIRKGSVHFQSVFVSKEVIKSPTWDETHYTLISTVHVPIFSQCSTVQENFHGLDMEDLMSPC